MKYFTYDLVAAANDWIEQSREAHRLAENSFSEAIAAYHQQLDGLKHVLSDKAWTFFRYGREDASLHDSRLVSAEIGDFLQVRDGLSWPKHRNEGSSTARLEL